MMIRRFTHILCAVAVAMLFAIYMSAQAERTLHTFTSNNDGATPQAGLISDATGNLYGTTVYGGILNDCSDDGQRGIGCGTVFEMTPPSAPGESWKETVLHEFDSTDGESPSGPLLLDSQGNLYGTTAYAGLGVQGFVFELSPPAKQGGQWAFSNIGTFSQGGQNLEQPTGTLVMDAQGNLYGTAQHGGLNCGAVFELSPSHGSWTMNAIYLFGSGQNDGCYPQSGLIADSAGHLYGTTYGGSGATSGGTVFRLSRSEDGTWTSETVHVFRGGYDGEVPVGNLLISHRVLYGATQEGGDTGCGGYGCGTVYQITPDGRHSVIYRFVSGTLNGFWPESGLSSDLVGNLYGTTAEGGDTKCLYFGEAGCGTVYELSPPSMQGGKWTETMLYAFTGFNGDGALPMASVLWSSKGILYGTASEGGNDNCSTFETVGCGTVFALTK